MTESNGHGVDPSVYYRDRYWNDLPEVRAHLNARVSGDPEKQWFEHFRDRVDGRVFERALVLNCGNGWVERDLIDIGLVVEAVGIDVADELLDRARADAGERPLRYHQCDTNRAEFPGGPYDLVVNYSAAHHIRNVDRVFRTIAELLPDDGWFVNWDYVGPHRNQYPYEQWSAAWDLRESLPTHLQGDLQYPYLKAMLDQDPTEAVHSELTLAMFERYFSVDQLVELGGGLAYLVLTHNPAFLDAPVTEREPLVRQVLEADIAWTEAHPRSSLFAWFAGQPDRSAVNDDARLADWTDEEDRREAAAVQNGDRYYPLSALQAMVEEVEEAHRQAAHPPLAAAASSSWFAERLKASPLGPAARRVARPVRQLTRRRR